MFQSVDREQCSEPQFSISSLPTKTRKQVMHVSRYLVLVVASTLLARNGILATEVQSVQASFSTVIEARLLRVAKNTQVDSTSAEERGIATDVSTIISKQASNWRSNIWVKLSVSDDHVRSALGIEKGITVAALKQHPKFKTYENFKIGSWLKTDTATSKVWNELRLEKIPLEEVRNAPGFSIYKKYVVALYNKVVRYTESEGTMKKPNIVGGGTIEERAIKNSIIHRGDYQIKLAMMAGNHATLETRGKASLSWAIGGEALSLEAVAELKTASKDYNHFRVSNYFRVAVILTYCSSALRPEA
ncbi:hypothetical protein ON010_g15366 [Phytophthora cinnamomi]|nr:hypothetical protein ON010_g15366 [Phytophthora cinnamomi]